MTEVILFFFFDDLFHIFLILLFVYFDIFHKENALRSKSLFFQLFWKFFLRQKSYFDDLFQISLIWFRFILKKMHYDRMSIRSTFVQFFRHFRFTTFSFFLRDKFTVEIIEFVSSIYFDLFIKRNALQQSIKSFEIFSISLFTFYY